MRRFEFSTDGVPEAERFALWRETVSRGLFGTSPERPQREENSPFNAKIEALIGGPVAYAHYCMDPYRVRRQRQDIARVSWGDFVFVYRNRSDSVWINYGGTEFVARTGDLFVTDPGVPIELQPSTEFDEEVLFVPRATIEQHLPASGLRRILNLNTDSGAAGLAKSFFDAFVQQMPVLDERELVTAIDTFGRLLALACGAAAGEHGEAIRSARLKALMRYVDHNIADPGLTPEKVAHALKMSQRQLHLTFEPTGTSFSRYVLRRRLEECRAALIASPARPVTDIAFGWGFSSLASFYRAFQAAFGMAPGELRQQTRLTAPSMAE